MKATLVLAFCAAGALAQTAATTQATAPGCGPTNLKFSVRTDKSQHPSAQPDKDKALIFFMEDDASFESRPQPTTRLGVDGNWVGANHGNSYFYVPWTLESII